MVCHNPELFAATMNVHTREIVRRVLQENHKGKVKLTDSQVVLYWLCNHKKAVKKWVRNQVVEVFRFTDSSQWFFISSHNVIENLGTKRVADMRLVHQNSTRINGVVGLGKIKKNSQKTIRSNKNQHRRNCSNTSWECVEIELGCYRYSKQWWKQHLHGKWITVLLQQINQGLPTENHSKWRQRMLQII